MSSLRAIFNGLRPPLKLVGLDLDVVDRVRPEAEEAPDGVTRRKIVPLEVALKVEKEWFVK
jgi:hypothetical protein